MANLFASLMSHINKTTNAPTLTDKDTIAAILRTSPETLEAFEQAYQESLLTAEPTDNLFDTSAKQAAAANAGINPDVPEELNAYIQEISDRIVDELVNQTPVWEYDGHSATDTPAIAREIEHPVTKEELNLIPKELRPQLTGHLVGRQIGGDPSYMAVLHEYAEYKKAKTEKLKKAHYHLFRQGMDILDLDGILYEMLGQNPNAMGYWLPALVKGVQNQDFFKVPKTTIIKVPATMLQLTRLEYEGLNRTTLDIINAFCRKVFRLDTGKDYFIKTGTFSSKFDFRNAKVTGEKEVRELGEYLTFIQNLAVLMATPLAQPVVHYGVSTTNEYVVREFIPDKENNPCIYKGMPLHTEYRVFVDFDTQSVLHVHPYWDPDVMKQRFGHEEDADSPHNVHDYITYTAHEPVLMRRFFENKDKVEANVKVMLPDIPLTGQWSIDIMQNGDEFWIIDMALAANSAYAEHIPAGLLKPVEENWIPTLENK